MTTRSPKPDPARQMRLLWREAVEQPRQRGPRPALDVAKVVEAAIAIADDEGIDALTIRRLTACLNVSTMSVYTYVSGKVELLPLMLDALYGAMSRSRPATTSWRDRLTAIAEDNRMLFASHPWAATVLLSRPPLGPGMMAKYEYELQAFEGLGLNDAEIDSSLTYLLGFVATCARDAWIQRQAETESATSDQAWWEANAPLFALAFDPTRYPTAARVGAAAGEALGGAYAAAHAWDFGIARVLDGLEALIERRRGGIAPQ